MRPVWPGTCCGRLTRAVGPAPAGTIKAGEHSGIRHEHDRARTRSEKKQSAEGDQTSDADGAGTRAETHD